MVGGMNCGGLVLWEGFFWRIGFSYNLKDDPSQMAYFPDTRVSIDFVWLFLQPGFK
jgi:hypothetical protein